MTNERKNSNEFYARRYNEELHHFFFFSSKIEFELLLFASISLCLHGLSAHRSTGIVKWNRDHLSILSYPTDDILLIWSKRCTEQWGITILQVVSCFNKNFNFFLSLSLCKRFLSESAKKKRALRVFKLIFIYYHFQSIGHWILKIDRESQYQTKIHTAW